MSEEILEKIEYRLRQIQYLLLVIFICVVIYIGASMISSGDIFVWATGCFVFLSGIGVLFVYCIVAARHAE